MKRIILFMAAVSVCSTLLAQNNFSGFKPFKVDLGGGFFYPSFQSIPGSILKLGGGISLEPQYAVTKQLSIGLRLEAGIGVNSSSKEKMTTVYGSSDTATSNTSETETYESALLTANYFLGKGLFRPFLGAGIGDFSTSYFMGGKSNRTGNRSSSNLGEMIRLGFDVDHFWMDLEYNTIPPLQPGDIMNGYISVKLGIYFGGGKAK